jgi:hypothetical protein
MDGAAEKVAVAALLVQASLNAATILGISL